MRSSWKKVKVGQLGRIVTGKTPKTSDSENYGGKIPFLTPTDDMLSKFILVTERTLTEQGVDSVRNQLLPAGAIAVSCIGSQLGKVTITTQPTVTNQQINSIIVDESNFDNNFVYYAMKILGEELRYVAGVSTAVPIVNKSSFSQYEVLAPDIEEQRKISSVLSALDDKIAINKAINKNLEETAQAIFKSWFIDFEPFGGIMPADWKKDSLSNIAKYTNGLAMQNYRPVAGDIGLPVLKIKELRQGMCDTDSDLCSSEIDKEFIIHDGDVIFSWSGSLLVDLWCGGICGLNQHLFKVTSDIYDKWFYYSWTQHHLVQFQTIASAKATTMGHIKRGDLEKATVVIPSQEDYQSIGNLLRPIYDTIISNKVENKRLAEIRDALLPKLMSGEIDVSQVKI